MSYNIDHYYGEFIPVEKERFNCRILNIMIFSLIEFGSFPNIDNDEILRECYDSHNHLP